MTTAHHSNDWLWRLIARLAFNRITIINKQRLPVQGPVLFVATHRNGALDAAAYTKVVPQAVPMVSAQLHRLPLGRRLFRGIAVARTKDKARGIAADNNVAMQQSLTLLQQGGQLFIMPEGSSTLGPHHLPFHRGAARIAKAALEAGIKLTIVALGVHYEDPTAWQSRVEVLVGEPIQPEACDTGTLHRLISHALEQVGANFVDSDSQKLAQRLAYASTLGTRNSYALGLKSFEQALPTQLIHAARELEQLTVQKQLCLHQGVPLMPVGSVLVYLLYWLILLPLVASFVLFNLPVVIASNLAARLLPDDDNVIAFWRMTIGLPAGLIWSLVMTSTLLLLSAPTAVLLYWAGTLGGIAAWYRYRKLSAAVCNGLLHARSRSAVLRLYYQLLNGTRHDRTA